MSNPINSIPASKGHFILGDIPEIMEDRVKFLLDLRRDYGDVARIHMGPVDAIGIFHPDGVEHVLQSNHSNYTKETRTYASVRLVAGNGLLVSDGDFWLGQRRMMQPAFHQSKINALSEMICRETHSVIDLWDDVIKDGQSINVAHEMMHLTLRVATLALFGTRVSDPVQQLDKDIYFLLSDAAFRFEHPFYPPPWVPLAHNRKFNAAIRRLDQIVYGMIDDRRKHPVETNDLLAIMMEAQDKDDGTRMTNKQMRDEAVTLFLAGHETTAASLSWTLYLLSQHPEVETRLRKEVDEVLGGRDPTLADLPKLVYTRMVIDESMRLYPPAWLVERKALDDDEIGGYLIPKGITLAISQFVTHRHPDFWEDPHTFNPDRFDPQKAEKRHPYAFFPFGGGPRICIGKSLAQLETHLALPMLMQRARFEVAPGWEVKTEPEQSLRPKGGLWMVLTEV